MTTRTDQAVVCYLTPDDDEGLKFVVDFNPNMDKESFGLLVNLLKEGIEKLEEMFPYEDPE